MSRKLTALFNELNTKYFKNRLPAYQVVYKSTVRRQGYCDIEHHVIQVWQGGIGKFIPARNGAQEFFRRK